MAGGVSDLGKVLPGSCLGKLAALLEASAAQLLKWEDTFVGEDDRELKLATKTILNFGLWYKS